MLDSQCPASAAEDPEGSSSLCPLSSGMRACGSSSAAYSLSGVDTLSSPDACPTALRHAGPRLQPNFARVICPLLTGSSACSSTASKHLIDSSPSNESHLSPQDLLLRQLPPPAAACGPASPCWPGQQLPQPWLQLRLQLWGIHPHTLQLVPGDRQGMLCSAVGPRMVSRSSPE